MGSKKCAPVSIATSRVASRYGASLRSIAGLDPAGVARRSTGPQARRNATYRRSVFLNCESGTGSFARIQPRGAASLAPNAMIVESPQGSRAHLARPSAAVPPPMRLKVTSTIGKRVARRSGQASPSRFPRESFTRLSPSTIRTEPGESAMGNWPTLASAWALRPDDPLPLKRGISYHAKPAPAPRSSPHRIIHPVCRDFSKS